MDINKWYGLPPDRRYNRHSLNFRSAVAALPLKFLGYMAAAEAYIDLAMSDSIPLDYPIARIVGFTALGFIAGEFGERRLENCRLPEPKLGPKIPDNIILGEN